jgi:5'-nucleotidase / UDP-sugar diphosphatase
MKTILRRITSATVVILCCIGFIQAQKTKITIVHVNDTHSHLDAFGQKDNKLNGTIGGIAKAAYVIGSIRATESNVVLLHAGDAFVGDLFFNKYFGAAELQLMSQLGFDAMAVGNHEFDLGPDVLTMALGNASPTFPLLSANVDMSSYPNPALQSFIKSSTIIERSGVKIGIFGMTVPNDPTYNPAPVQILPNVGEIAYQMVSTLKAAGVDMVVCLSHLGSLYDQAIADGVPGIDVIVGGHDHYLFDQPIHVSHADGTETLIVQAGEFYENVGELQLTVENGKVSLANYKMIPVDQKVPKVPEIQAAVDQLKEGIVQTYGDVYHKVEGFAIFDLNRHYDPNSPFRDTPLGNLVTDALKKKGKTDIAVTALGLTSQKIYAGPIVGADVFRAIPFGFDPATGLGLKLVKMRIQGDSLLMGIETTLSFLGLSEDYFLQFSGMKFDYDATQPVGARVKLSSIRIGGKRFDPAAKYSVTMDEGFAALLPVMGVSATLIAALPDAEYNVVKDYIHSLHFVTYVPEGRIRDISVKGSFCKKSADDAVADELTSVGTKSIELMQNYPNPFNSSTVIRYSVPTDGHVSLKIYNQAGQEVATLVDEEKTAGNYDVTWNASGVVGGMYFYRLNAGHQQVVKKMVLEK